ncbi:MAG: helicase-related protein, partial [Pseudomonadota bacterium]
PQALLPRLTETCRRHGVPYSVVDQRAIISCPPLHSRLRLTDSQQEALRQLLLRDSGVLVAPKAEDRFAVAAELLARRQQRSLVVTKAIDQVPMLLEKFRTALSLESPYLAPHSDSLEETRVIVASYEQVQALNEKELRHAYGMVIFDDIHHIDPTKLMEIVRTVGARHLLGLAETADRKDGLDGPLYLALGGVIHQIGIAPARPIHLVVRRRPTDFMFPYEGRSQYQTLVSSLAKDEQRNRQIAQDVIEEANLGHPCLVLSERRDHLDLLFDQLNEIVSVEKVTSNVHPAERSRIISRFNDGQIMVLLATGQIATESITTPRVRRLFLCFPFSHSRKLERLAKYLQSPSEDKKNVVIYDYDDRQVDPLHRAFNKRAQIMSRLQRSAEKEMLRKAQMTLNLDVV